MKNLNSATFYEAQYGETRLVAFEILQKFFDEKNEEKIADIFSEILAKNAKKNALALEDFLEKIDDDLLQQLVVGLVDNIDEIDNIILEKQHKIFEKNILRLIIFELKYVDENSTQNIFENYQKICLENDLKFDKNLIIELIKTLIEKMRLINLGI
jgi:RNase H-fold protein (predicted Holliday junction resolvase)